MCQKSLIILPKAELKIHRILLKLANTAKISCPLDNFLDKDRNHSANCYEKQRDHRVMKEKQKLIKINENKKKANVFGVGALIAEKDN